MLNQLKQKAPTWENTPESALRWAMYLFCLSIASVFANAILQFITGLLAFAATACLLYAIVLKVIKRKGN